MLSRLCGLDVLEARSLQILPNIKRFSSEKSRKNKKGGHHATVSLHWIPQHCSVCLEIVNSNTLREEADRTSPGNASELSTWQSKVRFVAIQCGIVISMLLLIEVALAVLGFEVSPSEHLRSTYPANASSLYKVAIFGGSSAEGTYCPRGFEEILEHELKRRFPLQEFYIRNYARHGEPFHRYQAEYAKRLVGKYDLMLLYCGNNEAENWYDDSGYWRVPKYKENRDLVFNPPIDATSWPSVQSKVSWLQDNSRIFAAAARIKQGYLPPLSKNRNYDYAEFEEERSVPANELVAIADNFENDVREICKLAQSHGTQVLIAPATTFGSWPPSYSVLSSDLSTSEKQQWQKHYQRGKELAGDPQAALTEFQHAADIDDSVAILNYEMGMTLQQLGQSQKAQKLLTKAVDSEGHYFRCHSSIHQKAAAIGAELKNAHSVDLRKANQEVIEAGISEEELFTDICHPSLLGYAIIADRLVDAMAELPELASSQEASSLNTSAEAWQERAKTLYDDLEITKGEHRQSLAENVLYCFDLIHFSAYPNRCEAQIQDLMSQMEAMGDHDSMTQSFNAVSRARLAIRANDLKTSCEYINVALDVSPEYLETILDLKAWNHYIGQEFIDAGITFSPEKRRFVLSESHAPEASPKPDTEAKTPPSI